MHNTIPRAIMSALVASGVTSASSGISLSNFTPRIENLPSQCQAVYTRQVQGCTAGDFPPQGKQCSDGCVRGLVDISQKIDAACASVDVPETSIIGVFLLGQGVAALCPGIEVTTISGSSTSTSTQPQPQQTSLQTQTQAKASSTQPSTPSTSTGGIRVDPSPTSIANPPRTSAAQTQPTFAMATSGPASSPRPSSTTSSQKSNADSGGGSPFDVVATGASSHHGTAMMGTILGAVILLCASI